MDEQIPQCTRCETEQPFLLSLNPQIAVVNFVCNECERQQTRVVGTGTDQEGINEVTHENILEQAQAVQEAVTASMYYPVAHGEAEKLKQLIEVYENNG